MLKTYLPNEIKVNNKILKVVINSQSIKENINFAKSQKLCYRTIEILNRNLRGKKDLHGQNYKPTKWVFVEQY